MPLAGSRPLLGAHLLEGILPQQVVQGIAPAVRVIIQQAVSLQAREKVVRGGLFHLPDHPRGSPVERGREDRQFPPVTALVGRERLVTQVERRRKVRFGILPGSQGLQALGLQSFQVIRRRPILIDRQETPGDPQRQRQAVTQARQFLRGAFDARAQFQQELFRLFFLHQPHLHSLHPR